MILLPDIDPLFSILLGHKPEAEWKKSEEGYFASISLSFYKKGSEVLLSSSPPFLGGGLSEGVFVRQNEAAAPAAAFHSLAFRMIREEKK